MNESMPVGDCLITISARINYFLNEHKLSHLFVPDGRWEEGPGEAIAASTTPALHSPGFKTAARDRFKNEGTEKDLDQPI